MQVGRLTTVGLIILAGIVSLWLENALQAFQILLQIGAGTGLVFLLRWFWWRINAWSEVAAMLVSFCVAIYFQFAHTALGFRPWMPLDSWSSAWLSRRSGWLTVTFLTPPGVGGDASGLLREDPSLRSRLAADPEAGTQRSGTRSRGRGGRFPGLVPGIDGGVRDPLRDRVHSVRERRRGCDLPGRGGRRHGGDLPGAAEGGALTAHQSSVTDAPAAALGHEEDARPGAHGAARAP